MTVSAATSAIIFALLQWGLPYEKGSTVPKKFGAVFPSPTFQSETLESTPTWVGQTGYCYANNFSPFTCSPLIPGAGIAPGTITGTQIGAGAILGSNIAPGAITSSQIGTGAILGSNIAPGAIASSQIGTGAILGSNIAAGTITSSQIAPGTFPGTRLPNPGDFYMATTGNDSNTCLTLSQACLTGQRVVNLITSAYDLQGRNALVHVSAGTYNETTSVAGVMTGSSSGGGGFAAGIQFVGTGPSTPVFETSGSACGISPLTFLVGGGATVSFGSMTIETDCLNGYGIFAEFNAQIYLADANVAFVSGRATSAGYVALLSHSRFITYYPFTMQGSSTWAFWLSTMSSAVMENTTPNALIGTPNFSGAFVSGIDGSFFNWGDSNLSIFSGAATGYTYNLEILSYIDSEQALSPLPGSISGVTSYGSQYLGP